MKVGNGVSNENLPANPLLSLIMKLQQTWFKYRFCSSIGVHRLEQQSYRNSTVHVPLPAFTGCYRAKPWFDRKESGLRRLSSVTHRGHNPCRFATILPGGDTVDAGRAMVMPRNKPVLFRSPVSHGCLKKMKPPGPLPGEHRFNTV